MPTSDSTDHTLNGDNGDDDSIKRTISSRKTTLPLAAHDPSNLDDYFSGPLDPAKHSKYPFFMRVHGSVLPKLAVPLLFVAGWATAITLISQFVHSLAVDSILLTVLGIVIGQALAFRTSSAYERYIGGRRAWAQLTLHSRQLAHIIWIHARERPGADEKTDVLSKLTAINLILAFAQACKHKLRHEIEYDYTDLKPLIDNLDTFARSAAPADRTPSSHNNELFAPMKSWGEKLGVTFLESNPRRAYKVAARQGRHHGNLPFEIMGYLGRWIRDGMDNGSFESAVMQGQVYGAFNQLMDAYSTCDKVLQTPLPLAYNIAIAQITWLYVMVLPFQLYKSLQYIAIPGTVVAAYIILGLAAIGREIEDPFGRDVNDLDLDRYCESLQYDLNVLTASPASTQVDKWMLVDDNQPLWPYSLSGFNSWKSRGIDEIRQALSDKVRHQADVVQEGRFKSGERVDKKSHGV